jgi:hypothetical protein
MVLIVALLRRLCNSGSAFPPPPGIQSQRCSPKGTLPGSSRHCQGRGGERSTTILDDALPTWFPYPLCPHTLSYHLLPRLCVGTRVDKSACCSFCHCLFTIQSAPVPATGWRTSASGPSSLLWPLLAEALISNRVSIKIA